MSVEGPSFPLLCESCPKSLTNWASQSCSLKCVDLDLFPALPHHLSSIITCTHVLFCFFKNNSDLLIFLGSKKEKQAQKIILNWSLPLSSLSHLLVCVFYERVSLLLYPPPHRYTLSSNPPQVSMALNSKHSCLLNIKHII